MYPKTKIPERNLYRATFSGITLGGHVLAIASTKKRALKLMAKEINSYASFGNVQEEDLDIVLLINLPDANMKPYAYMIDDGDY